MSKERIEHLEALVKELREANAQQAKDLLAAYDTIADQELELAKLAADRDAWEKEFEELDRHSSEAARDYRDEIEGLGRELDEAHARREEAEDDLRALKQEIEDMRGLSDTVADYLRDIGYSERDTFVPDSNVRKLVDALSHH